MQQQKQHHGNWNHNEAKLEVLLGAQESAVQKAVPVTMQVHLLHLSPLGNTAPAL